MSLRCICREVKLSVLNLTVGSMIPYVSEDLHYQPPPKRVYQFSPSSVPSRLDSALWSGCVPDAVSQVAASPLPSLVIHSDSDLHLTPQNIMLHVWFPSLISQLSSPPPHSSGRSKVALFSVMYLSACYLSSGTLLSRCFGCGSDGKEFACNVGDLGWEDPLEKGMATHSSILAWRIPWT